VVALNVAEDVAHNAREQEAAKASGVVTAAVSDRLHRVGDGVHHRVHGRSRVDIFYLQLVSDSGEVPARSLTNFYSSLLTIV
jgi:hypothetical protein